MLSIYVASISYTTRGAVNIHFLSLGSHFYPFLSSASRCYIHAYAAYVSCANIYLNILYMYIKGHPLHIYTHCLQRSHVLIVRAGVDLFYRLFQLNNIISIKYTTPESNRRFISHKCVLYAQAKHMRERTQ